MSGTMIKLNNGLEVHIDEFISWSHQKQRLLTTPLEIAREHVAKTASKNQRAVITPLGEFTSVSLAGKAHGISDDALRRRLYNLACPEYRYAIPEPQDEAKNYFKELTRGFDKTSVKVQTPLGIFNSIKSAAAAHNITIAALQHKFYKNKTEYFRIEGVKPDTKIPTKRMLKTVTPLGVFESKKDAMIAHGLSKLDFSRLFKLKPEEYYVLDSKIDSKQ